MAVDPTFTVNDFNRPKVLTNLETTVNNILMLLFGKPGFYPSIPSIGMDIERYLYMFIDDIDTVAIKNELKKQCADFLPEVSSGSFDVRKITYNENPLLVFILPIIDDTKVHEIAIGITTDGLGKLMYKFIENKPQII